MKTCRSRLPQATQFLLPKCQVLQLSRPRFSVRKSHPHGSSLTRALHSWGLVGRWGDQLWPQNHGEETFSEAENSHRKATAAQAAPQKGMESEPGLHRQPRWSMRTSVPARSRLSRKQLSPGPCTSRQEPPPGDLRLKGHEDAASLLLIG